VIRSVRRTFGQDPDRRTASIHAHSPHLVAAPDDHDPVARRARGHDLSWRPQPAMRLHRARPRLGRSRRPTLPAGGPGGEEGEHERECNAGSQSVTIDRARSHVDHRRPPATSLGAPVTGGAGGRMMFGAPRQGMPRDRSGRDGCNDPAGGHRRRRFR
jgi:hypothetical protein